MLFVPSKCDAVLKSWVSFCAACLFVAKMFRPAVVATEIVLVIIQTPVAFSFFPIENDVWCADVLMRRQLDVSNTVTNESASKRAKHDDEGGEQLEATEATCPDDCLINLLLRRFICFACRCHY